MIQPGPLLLAGMGRINEPGEALLLAQTHRDAGYRCTTLHVGSGFETEPQIDRLVGAIVEASDVTGYPLFVETHRATITQDIRRSTLPSRQLASKDPARRAFPPNIGASASPATRVAPHRLRSSSAWRTSQRSAG
jgi:hypothetical protein